jgi:hypothetical protein
MGRNGLRKTLDAVRNGKPLEYPKKYRSLVAFASVCLFLMMFKTKLIILFGLIGGFGALLAARFYFHFLSVPSLIVAAVAALGSTFADYVIFRFFRDSFFTELLAFLKEELKVDLDKFAKRFKSSRLLNSRFGRKIVLPALAAAIIASPLPDEIGISILASQKMESKKFLPISFTLNFLGIAGIMKLARIGE